MDSFISIPVTLEPDDDNINRVELIDIYTTSVLRMCFILFKNPDFTNLPLSEQTLLMEYGTLKSLICLSFILFDAESKNWKVISNSQEGQDIYLSADNLLKHLPGSVVDIIVDMNVTANKLNFDWYVNVLCIEALYFTPSNESHSDNSCLSNLREHYIKMLLSYLQWKHGKSSGSKIFYEILKLMDCILKLCSSLDNVVLNLDDKEIFYLKNQLPSFDDQLDLSGSCIFATIGGVTKAIIASVRRQLGNSLFSSTHNDVKNGECPLKNGECPPDDKSVLDILLMSKLLKNIDHMRQYQDLSSSSSSNNSLSVLADKSQTLINKMIPSSLAYQLFQQKLIQQSNFESSKNCKLKEIGTLNEAIDLSKSSVICDTTVSNFSNSTKLENYSTNGDNSKSNLIDSESVPAVPQINLLLQLLSRSKFNQATSV